MIVHLEINSYIGASLAAIHYYAELRWTDCDPDAENSWKHRQNGRVYGKLTAKQAKDSNNLGSRKALGEKYKAGDTAFGWLTEEEAIQKGVKKFLNTFDPEKDILVLGSTSSAEPQPILHGPQELKDTIQGWLDTIAFSEKSGDKKSARKAEDAFWKFWKEYEKTQDNRVVKFDEWDFRK